LIGAIRQTFYPTFEIADLAMERKQKCGQDGYDNREEEDHGYLICTPQATREAEFLQ
jgi:hypothetical protein